MKKYFLCLFVFLSFSCNHAHNKFGIEIASKELKDALIEKSEKSVSVDNLICNEQTAIDIAEPILFKAYGKDQIIDERPYEVYLIEGYWVLNGTLPEEMLGGTFLIVLSAKDGRVIKLTHGK